MKRILNIICCFVFTVITVSAEQSRTQPLELPNFIIEGRAQLHVQSGIKQHPDKTSALSKRELDSLNSLEKQQSILLPTKSLPETAMSTAYKQGYLSAEFGRYSSPSINAGYGLTGSEFSVYLKSGLEMSSGHLNNSSYSKLYADGILDYIAPEKYWIFGGSKTRSAIKLKNNDYKLYAIADSPKRSTSFIDITIDSDGEYQGFEFSTGAGFKTMQLKQTDANGFDNNIYGYLAISSAWSNFLLGIDTKLDLHNVQGRGANFMEVKGVAKYKLDNLTFNFSGGLQSTGNTDKIQRAALAINADVEVRVSEDLTFIGGLETGFENQSVYNLTMLNPYIINSAHLDYPKYRGAKAFLYFHPLHSISLSAGMKMGVKERTAFFVYNNAGMFDLYYEESQKLELSFEGVWMPSERDVLISTLILNREQLTSNTNQLPFVSPFVASGKYKRNWFQQFGTQIGLNYIGERYIDIENKTSLKGFIDLNAELEYKPIDNFSVFARFENLLNSDIFIWQDYKERGIFLSAGILWNF